MKIKAAIYREKNKPLTIEDVEVSEPGPNEVLVKTVACGVCHSDLHALEGSIPSPRPAIFGHAPEFLRDAVIEGMSKGQMFGGQHEAEITVSEMIQKVVPCAELVRFSTS